MWIEQRGQRYRLETEDGWMWFDTYEQAEEAGKKQERRVLPDEYFSLHKVSNAKV